jgi:predicted nucleic acid-binding protein
MSIFIDTSAIVTLMNRDDPQHESVRGIWAELSGSTEELVTTGYVVLETYAVVQARFGLGAVRELHEDVWPALTVVWGDGRLHALGVEALLSAGRRHLGLVDCVSFHVMRERGIDRVFTPDSHFAEEGFEVVP